MPNTNTQTQYNFNGLTDWFTAFKGGEQTDSRGVKKVWSPEELDEIVSTSQERLEQGLYNSAPLVVGHPSAEAPSFGWLNGFKRVDDSIEVVADKVHQSFADGVKDGLWPNRSVSIGKDKQGRFYIRHIGFLGAAAPAIEGMDAIYNAADDEHFDYSLNDSITPSSISRILRGIRDFFIGEHGLEKADQAIPGWQIDSLAEHANNLREDDDNNPLFTKNIPNTPNDTGEEPMTEFSKKQLDEAVAAAVKLALEEKDVEFSQKEEEAANQLTAEKNKRLTAEFSADITTLVDAGKLLPAQAEGMAEFMVHLSQGEEVSFEFSAGEEGKEQSIKKSPIEWFKDFTQSIGKQIELSEQGNKDVDKSIRSEFSMQGASVDPERLELHEKALEYQRNNSGVSYVDAVIAVEK